MRAYTEPQLQAYVAENLEREGHKWFDGPPGARWWCEPQHELRLLGTEVQCAAGRIDILASLNRRPLIIELKARRAEDAVNGQVARYRSAVTSRYGRIRHRARMNQEAAVRAAPKPAGWQFLLDPETDYSRNEALTCIIAPEFSPACRHGLGMTHGFVARLDDSGHFEIVPLWDWRNAKPIDWDAWETIPADQLTDLLVQDALDSVGADIGSKWVDSICDALDRRDHPVTSYSRLCHPK